MSKSKDGRVGRVGGRGCPQCGSHRTFKAAWGRDKNETRCDSCGNKWLHCSIDCRGYDIELTHPDGPRIVGCRKCGVPDRIARTWSEGYAHLARVLIEKADKLEPTVDLFPAQTRAKTVGR